jgi:putative pyruvate formate lyase activating enzyme
MGACYQCPRECGVDRERGVGFCGVGEKLFVAKTMLHRWEEPCICGDGGAGTIFFSGCNLRCVYCQNCDISPGGIGNVMTEDELAREIFSLIEQGANCIEFVTPTHYTERLAALLRKIKHKIPVPVVWNSGGYEKVESLRLLEGLVDVYLPDFKYFSSEIAKNYSAAPDYCDVAMLALKEMVRQVGKPTFSSDDSPQGSKMLKKGVIVRHLALPSHREDSAAVLRLLAREIGTENLLLSLMSQYTPDFHKSMHQSGKIPHLYSPLCRKLTTFEYNFVTQIALDLGFEGYFQDKSSATSSFTPDFTK